jgi:hypothetical protein
LKTSGPAVRLVGLLNVPVRVPVRVPDQRNNRA